MFLRRQKIGRFANIIPNATVKYGILQAFNTKTVKQ